MDLSKSERRQLRELADQVYEVEARELLGGLDANFVRWRAGELSSSELLNAIHEFHRDDSRQLWSIYSSLREPQMVVARGLARGFIDAAAVPEALRERIKELSEVFRLQPNGRGRGRGRGPGPADPDPS